MSSFERLGLVLVLLGAPVAGSALVGPPSAQAQGETVRIVGRGRYVPEVHVVRSGDTLWDISEHYYGNPWDWPRLWSYNPEITNPHWIYPADRVRLRVGGERPDPSLPPSRSRASRARAGSGTIWLRDQGYLDEEARERSGVIIGSREDQMLLSEHDEVYVQFGDDMRPAVGTDYTVYRNVPRSERPDENEGVLVRVLGTVRLLDYDEDRDIGRAVITESLEPIERGFPVARIDRSFVVVPPRVNESDVEATLVALLQPTVFLANEQVGFVDKGSEEGVRLGNRFFVVRSGDEWRDGQIYDDMDLGETLPDEERPESYPDEVVGEARVVTVRDHSATVIVTNSTRPVVVGDRLEMREGF